MQPTSDKIFVSYSRHDEPFARKLAIWLANTLNLGVWIDIDDIQPGVKWSSAIQDGLDNCEVMVVIVTPESMQSINVEDEWQYFIDLGKPVVPILLRSAPVPYQLRRIQWIDFSDKDEYNNSLRQLIVELRQHLKPLESEADIPARAKSHKEPVVRSRKEKKTRRRMHDAEDLIEQQRRALKRSNRLVTFLAVMVLALGIGVASFFAWIYFTRPADFLIYGNTEGGFAILPGESEFVTLGSLDGVAPVGTRIQAGDEPIQLFSEDGTIETILQPDSIAAVNDLTEDGLDLELAVGNVSAETNGRQGRISLANGVDIETDNNVEVSIDPDSDIVTSSCFEGDCTVTDSTGDSVELVGGQSLTFSNSSPVLDESNIRDIPGAIAYVTNRHGAAEIYLMTYQGDNQTRLTNNAGVEDENPAWSPDGQFLAYVSTIDGSFDIWVMASSGEGEPVNLTPDSSQSDTSPAWSPDGNRIAFVSNRVNGIDDIYVMNADGTEVQRITTTGRSDSPAWSPDSRYLVFSSSRTGNDEIFILDVTDPEAEAINVSNNEASDTNPVWSPDGRRIAFVSNRDNNPEIYVLDITDENAEAINISHDTGRDFEPTWSPDSNRVMFTSERFGDLDIISVSANLDSSATQAEDVLRLTDEISESDQEAAWLPVWRAGQ